MDCFAALAMTAQHLDCLWLFEIRKPSLRGALATKQSILPLRGEMDCFAALAMTAQHLDCLWLFEIRKPSLRGAERRSNPSFLCAARWIASRSLSSGAHLRDPLARNDGSTPGLSVAV